MSREYWVSSSAETFGFLALFRVAMGGQLLVGEYSLALNYFIHQSLRRCEGEFGEGDSGVGCPGVVVAVSRAIAWPRAGDLTLFQGTLYLPNPKNSNWRNDLEKSPVRGAAWRWRGGLRPCSAPGLSNKGPSRPPPDLSE